ncbi:MAG: hypothetical protein ACTSU5_03660, partial [Promethearchaeota archaeon]
MSLETTGERTGREGTDRPDGKVGVVDRPFWWKLGNVAALVGLSFASILSFFSMGLVVPTYYLGTLSYQSKVLVPTFIAAFLFASQLIPGYFSSTKKLMLATLLFSAILVGVLFTIIRPVTGPIYGAACA